MLPMKLSVIFATLGKKPGLKGANTPITDCEGLS
jgi:hypothetical protein